MKPIFKEEREKTEYYRSENEEAFMELENEYIDYNRFKKRR